MVGGQFPLEITTLPIYRVMCNVYNYFFLSLIKERNNNTSMMSMDSIEFRSPNLHDIAHLETNFSKCDFIGEFIKDVREKQYSNKKVLLYNGTIIGCIILYSEQLKYKNSNVYYMSAECTIDQNKINTVDSQPITFKPEITPIRLLWAYSLLFLYKTNRGKPFVVYTHAVPDAYSRYLKQLQMVPSSTTIFLNDMPQFFIENPALNGAGLAESDFFYKSDPNKINEFDHTYLFYDSAKGLNYTSVDTIFKHLYGVVYSGGGPLNKSKDRIKNKTRIKNKSKPKNKNKPNTNTRIKTIKTIKNNQKQNLNKIKTKTNTRINKTRKQRPPSSESLGNSTGK